MNTNNHFDIDRIKGVRKKLILAAKLVVDSLADELEYVKSDISSEYNMLVATKMLLSEIEDNLRVKQKRQKMKKIRRLFKRLGLILMGLFIFPFVGLYWAIFMSDKELDETTLFWDNF